MHLVQRMVITLPGMTSQVATIDGHILQKIHGRAGSKTGSGAGICGFERGLLLGLMFCLVGIKYSVDKFCG